MRFERGFFCAPVEGMPAAGRRNDWWESALLWWLIALASMAPFILTPLPPISDLFSHIGRYHVMLFGDRSEFLLHYYRFEWRLIANLGQDLLMVPVGWLFGAERGAFLLTMLLPPATILAFRQLSIAVHGRVEPATLFALPFSYAFPFLFGFVNYTMGVVLTLWSLVFWYRYQGNTAVRWIVLIILSFLIWLCHLAAWGVFLVAIGWLELHRAWQEEARRPLPTLAKTALRMAPLLLPLLLTILWRASAPSEPINFGLSRMKFFWLFFTLRDQSKLLDLLSQFLLLASAVALIAWRHVRLERAFAAIAVSLFALFLILPSALMAGFFADLRLLPAVAIFAFLCFRMQASQRLQSLVALAAIALFLIRLSFTTAGFLNTGRQLEADLRALDGVKRGARIAVLVPQRMCDSWANNGLSHLASLAIVRREAFVTTEWDIPGQQLMRPIYNAGRGYNSDLDSRLGLGNGRGNCKGIATEQWFAGLPRDRFDYVWLFKTDAPAFAKPGLIKRFANRDTILYEIRK